MHLNISNHGAHYHQLGHHCLSHLGWRVQWPESLSVHLALHSAQYRLHTLHKSGTAQSALYMYIAVHTQKLHNRHKTASKIHTVKQCGWGRPSYSSITVGLQQHCPLRILAWQVFAIHPQPQPAPRYLAAVHSRAGNICTAAVEYRALLILSLIQVRLARPSHGRRPTRKDSVFSPTPTNPTTSNSPTSPAGIQTDPDMVGRKIFEDVHVWRTLKIAKEQ